MQRLKFTPEEWEIEQVGGDFEIKNQNNQLIADVWGSGTKDSSPNYPSNKEASIYAELFKKSPKMARSLLEIRDQLKDEKKHAIIVSGIDSLMEGLIK